MPALACGIDIGSTNVKVMLSDEEGRAVFTRAVPTPRLSDGFGVATDAAALVGLLETMVVEGWRELGAGAPLQAIATTGVGEDGVGTDADLTPTGLAIPWFDARAADEAAWLRASPAATPRAGIAIEPDRTAAKWSWLRRHKPEDLADARCWIALADFPSVWWSGRPFMSQSLAPRTACYDVFGRAWIEPLLAAAGAPPLPPLVDAGSIVGGVRGGVLRDSGAASSETLIVAGGHDHPVAASAIRRLDATARVDSIGTANLVYGEAPGPAVPYLDPFVCFSLPPSGAAGVSCLGVMEFSASLKAVRTDEALFRGVLADGRLPSAPPEVLEPRDIIESGAIAVRRALERATFHARRMLSAMTDAGTPPGPIYATGGWSRSRALVELRASIFGQSIHVIDEPELTAIGAAYLAAQAATGVAPRLEATRRVVVIDPVNEWSTAYDRLFPVGTRSSDAGSPQVDRLEPDALEPARRSVHGGH